MTAAGPWSVKGIDPKAREVAKDMARRSGLTLGEWLNQMIVDGREAEPPPLEMVGAQAAQDVRRADAPPERAAAPFVAAPSAGAFRAPPLRTEARASEGRWIEAPTTGPQPSSTPLSTAGAPALVVSDSPPSTRATKPASEPAPATGQPALASQARRNEDIEVGRITRLLETLSTRLEVAEHRSSAAIRGIDDSVMGVLSRLEIIDRDQSNNTEQLEAAIVDVRDMQAKVAERVRRIEHQDSSRVEALRALEGALSRVAVQIQDGGGRSESVAGQTRDELESLGRRVTRVELAADAAPSAYADGERTRSELETLARRVNRVEANTDAAPNVFANAGQTREELDGLVRRMTRVEAATEAAPTAYADAEITHDSIDGLTRRMGRVETFADSAPDLYAEGPQTRDELEGLTRRLSRVEASTDVAPNIFAHAGQTREELDGLVRRMTRVEAAADAAPNLYADAGQTRTELDGAVRRLSRVEAAVEAVPSLYADAASSKQQFEGLTGRVGRVEAFADAASRSYASAAKTREDFDALGRRVARVETAADAAPTAYADASQTREELDAVARRLVRVEAASEAAPKAYADAEKVDTVLSRMAERLERAEARTTAAVQSLESSFAGLDARMRTAESRLSRDAQPAVEIDRRFQTLAAELAQKVEASRTEFAQRLRTSAADGRLDRMEVTLRDLNGQVDHAERRSAQALEHIGREVVNIANSLGERLTTVEDRGAAAVESMSGEIARIADVVETRFQSADAAQADALERLGGEIARIAETLTERVAVAERRSATSLDEVTDKVAEISEKLTEQQQRERSELTDRIRESESRTAQLLDEARQKLNQRPSPPSPLASRDDPDAEPMAGSSTSPALAAAAPQVFAPAESAWSVPSFAFQPATVEARQPALEPAGLATLDVERPSAFAAASPSPVGDRRDVPEPPAYEADPFDTRAADFPAETFDPSDDFEPFFPTSDDPAPTLETSSDSARADGEAPLAGHEPSETFSVRDFSSVEATPTGVQSTRDMIEAARAAARRSSGGRESSQLGAVPVPPLDGEGRNAKPFGITFPGRRKKEAAGGPTLRTIFLASGWAAAITTAAIGAHALSTAGRDKPAGQTGVPQIAETADAPTATGKDGSGELAVALAPTAAGSQNAASPDGGTASAPSAARPTASKSVPPDTGRSLYADAVRQIEAGDQTGVMTLRRAANLGDAPAQFYLGRLFEAGGAGLKKDLGQARLWTERAAKGGEPAAMYNLASYYYAGEGGTKDVAAAADWFQRAAERGVVNSQYNLAQLYEKGYGAPQSPAEAYKWYLVAAASGDAQAKADAGHLKPRLSVDSASAAEASAAALYAKISGAARTAAVASATSVH